MAINIDISADFTSVLSQIGAFLANVRMIFMRKVVQAYYRALEAIIRYSDLPSVRGLPPNAKTGRLLNSFRSVTNIHRGGTIARFYAVDYAKPLRVGLERPYAKFAWLRVRPQLGQLFLQAIAEAGRGR